MVNRSTRLEVILGLKDDTKKGFDQAAGNVQKFSNRLKGMRTQLLIGGAAIAGLAATSVKAASDLEESAQAAEVTFKDSFQAVEDFANNTAGAFNLSRRAAFEYTAQLGGIFNASGLAADASANMSVEATKLAADLASFKNLNIDVALQKIRAGLVGEVEPLRTVGVLLNAASVEAKAMQLGLADVNGEVSEGAKVQARFAVIMEQLADAQGDVARTSESVANKTRELQKDMEDLRAEIGEELLPVTAELLSKLSGTVQVISDLPKPAKDAGLAIGGVTAALIGLGLVIPPLVVGATSVAALATAIGSIVSVPILTGLAALGAGVGVVAVGMKDLANDVKEAEESLHGFDGILKTIGEQRKYDQILQQMLDVEGAVDDWSRTFEELAIIYTQRMPEIAEAQAQFTASTLMQMESIGAAYEGVKNKNIEMTRMLNDNGRLVADNVKENAKIAEETAWAEAEAIVAAAESRFAKLKEIRDAETKFILDRLAVQAENAKKLEEGLFQEILDAARVFGQEGGGHQIGVSREQNTMNVMRAFKDSQNEIVEALAEQKRMLAAGEFVEGFANGTGSRAGIEAEIARLEALMGSDQFKGTALGAMIHVPGTGFPGFPGATLDDQGRMRVPGTNTYIFPNASGLLTTQEVEKIAGEVIDRRGAQSNGFNNFNIGAGDTSDIR